MPAPGPRPRLLLVLGLLAFLGTVAVLAALSRPTDATPEGVFEYVRRCTLEGDGDAFYRMMNAEARDRWVRAVDEFRAKPDSPFARKYREGVGVSREEVERLSPQELLRRECLGVLVRELEGSRVLSRKAVGPDLVLVQFLLRERGEKWWLLRRSEGGWRIENPNALVTVDGKLLDSLGPR